MSSHLAYQEGFIRVGSVWYPNVIRILRSSDLDHIREATMADQEAGSPNAAQIEFWNSAAARAWADQYERMGRARSSDLDHIREATMADQEAGSPNAAQIEFWN